MNIRKLITIIDWKKVLGLSALIAIGIGGPVTLTEYRHVSAVQDLAQAQSEFASSTAALQYRIATLEQDINKVSNRSQNFVTALQDQKNKTDIFADQIGKVSDTVTTINKLSKIDPQLLQKYSKVYFLNEHYTPASLTNLSPNVLVDSSRTLQINTQIQPYLENLLKAAADDKIDLRIASAYRSFGAQSALKSAYKVTYGAGTANQFSADQGYSEHQLGTTLDFSTVSLGSNFDNFDSTTAYTWLMNNAYKYGFILSYPKSNTYYEFEPWHWRFVGVDLANRLHRENKNFYDLDQRIIDEYLLVLFN